MCKAILELNETELQEFLKHHIEVFPVLYSEEYINKINWDYIPINFIQEYEWTTINWMIISQYRHLSEKFIAKHKDLVDWSYISEFQKLSEAFIEEYADKVDWDYISEFQKLSEKFIEKYINEVDWIYISESQKLSESFIERHIDKVDWFRISKYQKLSEKFIERYADKVNWKCISMYQKLSKEFVFANKNRLDMKTIKANWLNKSTAFKKQVVMDTGLYECYDDYFIAYKGIRSDRYSAYNFQYQYLPGETYECFSDGSANENSFGLSAWTKEGAEGYCGELVVKVKIYYEDVARVVHNGGKIRASKMTILN